jgi:hypothetical protein
MGHLPAGRSTVPIIHRRAVYTLEQARQTLQLAKNCLPREIRLGRLRAAKRAGKYLILGIWLLQWVQAGEVRRRQAQPTTGTNDAEEKS